MQGAVCITGVSGFIGFHLAQYLLQTGCYVVGVDRDEGTNLLSSKRVQFLRKEKNFHFCLLDVTKQEGLEDVFRIYDSIEIIVHLAARTGVRCARKVPQAYVHDNISGYVSLLEACRILPKVRHVLYASSSSVYGELDPMPFEEERLGKISSLYAATKRMNELTAQAYAHLYGIPQTGMRFFTVYGPWGRPEMAYYVFAKAIRDGNMLSLGSDRGLCRDFTYVGDIVLAICSLFKCPPVNGREQIVNIGSGEKRSLGELVSILEMHLSKRAQIKYVSRSREDVLQTAADTSFLEELCGWKAEVSLEEGMKKFVEWFQQYSPL